LISKRLFNHNVSPLQCSWVSFLQRKEKYSFFLTFMRTFAHLYNLFWWSLWSC